jgi:hypothetical protein
MPEQQSQRGGAVASAGVEAAPFETQLIRCGQGGLNLKDSLDALEGWSRLTNLDHENNGEMQGRAGQTSFATGGSVHHSVRKLRDPQAGSTTRVWGIDTDLYIGASGVLSLIDSGYSGDPLTLVPHRPPLSGDPWMFVADRTRLRKVRADGLDLPIGLPAPGAAVTTALGTELQRSICAFDSSDGSQAASWVPTAGKDKNGHPPGLGTATDVGGPLGGSAVDFRTNVTGSTIDSAYDSWWGLAASRTLVTLDPGGVAASDDDYFHLWMKTSHPQLIQEVRIYFVVSAVFDPAVLPGTAVAAGGANADAYVKGFRQHDFAQFIQAAQTQIAAAETARVNALRDRDLRDRRIVDTRASWADVRAAIDPERSASIQIGSGAHQWFELGTVGLAVRRGDFQRIGHTGGRDWSTVTGIIVYVKTDITDTERDVAFTMDDSYLTGGRGPDTGEPGNQQYDYRCTHYDPRTGAEGNGSPEQVTASRIDSLRRRVVVTPAAGFGDGAVRQRFYRRGGTLFTNWFFLGANSSDGGAFNDDLADDAISAAGSLPIDHFQPVPTVNDAGTTVLAQPLPALWGPIEGMLMGCGDPYRPGHVYFCLPGAPDHWSSSGNVEVCPPSEELMHGGLLGHQAFVFSRAGLYMLYPNLSGTVGAVSAAPTLCKRGLFSRWGFVVGPGGVYFVSEDGIFLSAGGPEEWISRDIDPLFRGEIKNGYQPVNKAAPNSIRLTIWENKLYFQYQASNGSRHTFVYSTLHKFWRHYAFGRAPSGLQGQDEDDLLIGAASGGATYTHTGTSDDGVAIAAQARTGAFTGGRREEKLFGDLIVDAIRRGVSLSVTNYLNEETVANAVQTITEGTGRQRYLLDGFGASPQKAHSISTDLAWSTLGISPVVYQLGYAITLQPEITANRVTHWDDLGHPDEKWVTGITFDVDTGNVARTILIERDFAGVRSTVDTLTVTTNGRHKVAFSWLAVPAHMVRVRPNDDCRFWMLYRADWIWQPEPPRTSKWDLHFENAWDQYYTGLDLYCDTGGLQKDLRVTVDEQVLTNPGTGLTTFPVTATGRRVVHLTFTPGRGHVFRCFAIDANEGLLYQHRWQVQDEPSEQANWNQNFTVEGTQKDKWLHGVLLECDTFNIVKNVRVELDGVLVTTLSVQANGRSSLHFSFPRVRGRVLRLLPADGNPGRLYSHAWLLDEQPEAVAQWESLEENLGDSYYTGLDVECDTLGLAKTLEVFVDGTSLGTFSVTTTTRRLAHLSFGPGRGHVYRFRSTDANPGHLYTHKWLAEPEPGEQTNWQQNFTVEQQLRDKWLKGILIECDTFGLEKSVRVEVDGALHTTLSITATGRQSLQFSWPRIRARVLRFLPTDANPGRLYSREWLFDAEPEQIARWDSNEQLLGDSYYTGLDLEVDTSGAVKSVEVYIDQALIGTYSVSATGRRIVHLTFGPGWGHVYRFRAIDANLGYLYSHHWQTEAEPSEQANWNQNFSIYGTRADKWLKAIIFECDTFGQNKQVQVEVDGTQAETLTVNANGRRVVQLALATQRLGRVWRMLPADGNPGRLYTAQPIFDEEPFQLTRWETQETNHGLPGWFAPLYGHLTLKSTAVVTLTLALQINQRGTTVTETYEIPSTGGVKVRHFQSFKTERGGKGVLIKYTLTSPAAFYLYREETVIQIQPWGAAEPIGVQPFGNSGEDPTRGMVHTVLAAQRSGGSLGDHA